MTTFDSLPSSPGFTDACTSSNATALPTEVIGFLLFFGFATDENRHKMAILPFRSTFRSVQQPPEFV